MPLTDAKIRAAKPNGKAFKMPDGGGLHLFMSPTGVRSWRYRYEREGREQTAVLGRYPEMSLADARRARDDTRSQQRSGQVAAPAASHTFEMVAREWHDLNKPRWKPQHAADVLESLEEEAFPTFGGDPVDRIGGSRILQALRIMEQRGAVETARRVRQRCSAVFGYAIAKGWASVDPTAGLKAALAPLPPKGRRPALSTLEEARVLIQAIDGCTAKPIIRVASRFIALTAARPGEVAGLRWDELHLEGAAEWRLPPERTKIVTERAKAASAHIIPLTPAAIACLEAIRPLSGRAPFVFPNLRSMHRPMSENALGDLLERLGYRGRHVPHGWRSTFSTVLNERFPADRQIIDLMLAHTPKDRVEAAYNRAQHTARRRELAEAWSDLLLEGAAPAADLMTGPRRSPSKNYVVSSINDT